jgi:ribonuclease HIII
MNEKKVVKTITSSAQELKQLEGFMRETAWDFSEVQHAHFKAQQGSLTVVAYRSGKIVVSGPESEMANILETLNVMEDKSAVEDWTDHIGVDESGKGDFFGPLVVAGAFISKEGLPLLSKLGVRDSKTISDKAIKVIKNELVKVVDSEVIVISPSKYNELYKRTPNINKLLAWGHARVIENLLERHPDCRMAVSDQFSKSKARIQNALLEKGQQIELLQMHKGESDPAVAAASVLARAKFVESLDKMSKEFDINLPKGASDGVILAGKEFCTKYGKDRLNEVAKLHFSTSTKVLA